MFARGKSTVGLDIGASSVKLVELQHAEDGVRMTRFGEARLDPDVIVDGEIMDRMRVIDGIGELYERLGITRRRVVCGVHGRGVMVKKIVMERMDAEEASEAIYWEAEQHVPYDINDITVDYEVLDAERGPKQMQVMLVAAKRDLILNLAEVIREADLVVEAVDVNGFAVQNAIESSSGLKANEVVGLLNIGADITNLNVVRDGIPLYTQDLSLGGHSYLQAIQKNYQLSREEVEQALQESPRRLDVDAQVDGFCADLATSLDKSLNYLRSSGEAEELDRIVLCGGGALIPGLVAALERLQPVAVELADPLRAVRWEPELLSAEDAAGVAPRFAVGIGLALRKERVQ